MYRHILVPLDGSPLAEAALPAAVTVAHRWGGRVTLLHVQETNPPATIHGTPHLQRAADAERYLNAARERLARHHIEVTTHVHRPETRVTEGIAGHAVELGADLVILSTHGGHWLRSLMLGARAREVLGRAAVPVLTVPPLPSPMPDSLPLDRVLVPLDGNASHEAVLAAAATFAEPGMLALVRVVPTAETVPGSAGAATRLLPHAARALLDAEVDDAVTYLGRVAASLRSSGPGPATFVARGDPAGEILSLARSHDVHLIALATHARSGMAAAWEGSVPWRLIERGQRAVLVVLATETAPET